MAFPNPDLYANWQDYARALNQALATGNADVVVQGQSVVGNVTGGSGGTGSALPDGFKAVWLSEDDAQLFLSNPEFDPPQAADLFRIDTANIAEAAIATANLGPGAVTGAKIADAAIGTAQIGTGVIVTAHIGEAQIVSAKIADLAVNEAKIANLAVTSGKIANLAVGSAHIQDAAVGNVKIGNLIQSYGWDGVNGWRITKDGSIEGTNIIIRNPDGSVAFASGSKVKVENIQGLGALAGKDKVTLGTDTLGFGALAALGSIDLATQATGFLDRSRTTGFGTMAALSMLTAGNISTFIEGAAITRALIANAAIGTANIDVAAITSALIQDLAVTNAKLADASITNAKIANLSFDKMTAGTLNAQINMGTGTIVFSIGGSQLILGRGFGSSNQFFLWFGPAQVSMANCTEANGLVYFKTNGAAYFGGSLSAGTLRNAVGTSSTAPDATVTNGPFGSNGNTRTVVLSYNFFRSYSFAANSGAHSFTGNTNASIELLNGAGFVIGTVNVTGGVVFEPSNISDPGTLTESMGGSTTVTDTSGGTNVSYSARIVSRNTVTVSGNLNGPVATSQQVNIISTEG